MNQWQLDLMVETEMARAWAEENAPDPFEDHLKAAGNEIQIAVNLMTYAEDYIVKAMDYLEDTPMEPKVGSFLDSLENLRFEIGKLGRAYAKGERE